MREPIQYIERTRRWYQALGFETPYIWAKHDDLPFCRLPKPLTACRIGLITTAALYDPTKGEQGPGAPYNGGAKFFTPYRAASNPPADTCISHIAYDRDHTSAADHRAWFPLAALTDARDTGRIGDISPDFYGAPTNRSQRVTRETDAPALLSMLREDAVDAAVLVPNCPVCHQTVTLIARHLEQHQIPTVVMGCAKDIVERASAPRFVFSDFPLGNSAGKPHDPESQAATLELAFDLLDSAETPGKTVQNEQVWNSNARWKLDYANPDQLTPEELAIKRAAFDREKSKAARQK